jgi:hypothetical protein
MLFLTASQHPDLTSRFRCRNARIQFARTVVQTTAGPKDAELARQRYDPHCWARSRSPRGQRGVYLAKVKVERVRALVSQSQRLSLSSCRHTGRGEWQRRLERRQTDPRSEDPAMSLNAVADVRRPDPWRPRSAVRASLRWWG